MYCKASYVCNQIIWNYFVFAKDHLKSSLNEKAILEFVNDKCVMLQTTAVKNIKKGSIGYLHR